MLLRLRLWLYGIGIALLGVVGAYIAGRRQASETAKVQDLKDYAKTRKAMDDAEANFDGDPDLARRWLHERGKSDGSL